VKPTRPAAKAGIVVLGLVIAFAAACLAIYLRQRLTQGPDARGSGGMYAAGDMFLGIAVFGLLALAPLALGFYWLRSSPRFWSLLTCSAIIFALTGPIALAAGKWSVPPNDTWGLIEFGRIGLMPFTALALLACALFAPVTRHRWLLLATSVADGALFAGVVLVHLILPRLRG
jgi:hypothetical protein